MTSQKLMAEVSWARVIERRAEYQAWTDRRLTLDTSIDAPESLLAEALNYVRASASPSRRA